MNGIAAVAGIISWLSATGLRSRHDHFATSIFQQARSRKTNARPKQVDETGDKQSSAWRTVRGIAHNRMPVVGVTEVAWTDLDLCGRFIFQIVEI